jgi:hypothetical protein
MGDAREIRPEGDMEHVNEYVGQAVTALQTGFLKVNEPAGLVIALIAAILISSWRNLVPMALLATIVLVAIKNLPTLQSGHLPNFTQTAFWTQTGGYLLGYLIIIAVFFGLKSMLFGRGGPKAAKAH